MITSEDVREELATIAPQRECDRRAELSALFHSAGSLHLRGGGDWALHLDLGSGAAARRAFALLRESGLRSEIRTYRRRAFDTATRFQLHVAGDADALRVLAAAGVVDRRHAPLQRPPRRVVSRSCCRGAYLRGAFLGAGSLSLGSSPHLEQRSVVAETRSRANRLANADHANLVRTSRSAQRQLEAVERLRAGEQLDGLPDRLREAAELRLRHPTESLRELAARADPPATKAALHRRLRSLEELAADHG